VALLFALVFLLQASAAPTCADVADCRAQAESAAARRDFDAFDDLAWRAVQKGRKNDTDLMFLLARAQSLSGHLDDALVMLERIGDLGVRTDADTNPDFAQVRLLARWPEVAAKLGFAPRPPAAGTAAADAATAASSASAPAASPGARSPAAGASGTPAGPAGPAGGGLEFNAPSLAPVGLAHDAVSKRFVVGDRMSARLLIIDEMSHHVVNYASGATAGFYDDLTGFAIDPRRGDLWVASAKGRGDQAVSVLHKLQLVSGRTLMEVHVPEGTTAARLVDVTVAPDGTVYAIDDVDARLFRLRPGTRRLEQVMRLGAATPTAITAADDRVLYVATSDGLLRVDVTANKAAPVKSVEQLTQFVSLSWRGDALVGVERVADSFLVVRIALDSAGTRAEPRAILAASTQPTVGTLTPEGFYYLATPGTIRLVKVR
jgi:hypothetical protein